MIATTEKTAIGYTLASVNQVDITVQADSQAKIDNFLDAIIKLRQYLNDRADMLDDLEEKMHKLFRLDYHSLTEEDFFALQMLYEVCKRIDSNLKRTYAQLRPVREKGIAKKDLKRFYEAIDIFEETATDMYQAFFVLPHLPAFQTSDEELKAIFG